MCTPPTVIRQTSDIETLQSRDTRSALDPGLWYDALTISIRVVSYFSIQFFSVLGPQRFFDMALNPLQEFLLLGLFVPFVVYAGAILLFTYAYASYPLVTYSYVFVCVLGIVILHFRRVESVWRRDPSTKSGKAASPMNNEPSTGPPTTVRSVRYWPSAKALEF